MFSSAIRGRVHLGSIQAWDRFATGRATTGSGRGGRALAGRSCCGISIWLRNISALVGPPALPSSVCLGERVRRLNVHSSPFLEHCTHDGVSVCLQFWAWVHYAYQLWSKFRKFIPFFCVRNTCRRRYMCMAPSSVFLVLDESRLVQHQCY